MSKLKLKDETLLLVVKTLHGNSFMVKYKKIKLLKQPPPHTDRFIFLLYNDSYGKKNDSIRENRDL